MDFENKFKEAMDFLESSGISSPNKPVIPHALRVGKMLYEKGFSDEIYTEPHKLDSILRKV